MTKKQIALLAFIGLAVLGLKMDTNIKAEQALKNATPPLEYQSYSR